MMGLFVGHQIQQSRQDSRTLIPTSAKLPGLPFCVWPERSLELFEILLVSLPFLFFLCDSLVILGQERCSPLFIPFLLRFRLLWGRSTAPPCSAV